MDLFHIAKWVATIHYACTHEHLEIISELVDTHGINPLAKDKVNLILFLTKSSLVLYNYIINIIAIIIIIILIIIVIIIIIIIIIII